MPEKHLLIHHVRDEAPDLDVQAQNFFICTEELEVLIHCSSASRLRP
jgi:hypothetical protein